MDGDEVLRLPPDRLYTRYDAETAQKWAEKVYSFWFATIQIRPR
jgi:HEPN domain-containing protein